jgi:hypothetical protein
VSTLEPTREQQVAAHAHALQERIKHTSGQIRSLWVDLARDLHDFSEGQHWRSLGHDTFESWMASPDIDLNRRTVFKLLEMYRELVVKRQVPSTALARVEWSKWHEMMPAIRRGHVTPEQALADAEVTPQRDLRERYRQITARSPGESEPAIDPATEEQWVICPACGGRMRVRGIE